MSLVRWYNGSRKFGKKGEYSIIMGVESWIKVEGYREEFSQGTKDLLHNRYKEE